MTSSVDVNSANECETGSRCMLKVYKYSYNMSSITGTNKPAVDSANVRELFREIEGVPETRIILVESNTKPLFVVGIMDIRRTEASQDLE